MASVVDRRDIKHPNTFSISRGNTQLSEMVESINQSIGLILSTSRGELFGDPTFGSRLKEFFFNYVGDSFNREIQDLVAEELTRQESRIIVNPDSIDVSFEDKTVTIKITYDIKYTDIVESYSYITQIMEEGD